MYVPRPIPPLATGVAIFVSYVHICDYGPARLNPGTV